tara:strand:+ start:181 stop:612 length:432 start_codon:yes stop_codon:yes gene_type:complete
MRRRHRSKPIAEINVVPYIDVMLVLLIVFIVTAPLITQGVHVDLPQGHAQALNKKAQPPIVATVDDGGQYYLNAEGSDKSEMILLEELAHRVAALLVVDPTRNVVVRGAKDVSYNQVVQLMITLQSAGVASVGLMTDASHEDQ